MLGKIVKMDKGQIVVIVVSCLLFEDKLFYHLKETVLNPLSMDSRNFIKPLKWYVDFTTMYLF